MVLDLLRIGPPAVNGRCRRRAADRSVVTMRSPPGETTPQGAARPWRSRAAGGPRRRPG